MSRNPLVWWNQYWFAPVPAVNVSAFRVLLGAFLVIYFLTFAFDVTLMFSSDGVYFPWLLPDYGPPPFFAWLIYLVTLASMGAFTVGYRTRITTPLTLLLFLYHYFLQLAVKHSTFERLIIEWLLILCFVESARVWSWRAIRESPEATATPTVEAWAGRLVRFQTVMLYLGAGLWKLGNANWRTGVLLQATMQGMWSTDAGFWLARALPTQREWSMVSLVVIVSEILLGMCFFFRRTRPLAVVGGIAFHLGNVIFLSIPEFLVCITPYVFFVESATLQRFGDRLLGAVRSRVGRWRSSPSTESLGR